MPRALIVRPGHALGDAIFTTPIPRLAAEKGYDVDIACEESCRPIFANNPHIHDFIEVPQLHNPKMREFVEGFGKILERYDTVLHAHGYVEVGLMYRTDTCWGSIPVGAQRREIAKGKNYMDEILANLGFEERGLKPEFYFTPEEETEMTEMREHLNSLDQKLILWQWDGSTQSKILVWGPTYLDATLRKYPKSIHYIFTQDANLKAQIPNDKRVIDGFEASVPVRDSIKLCRIADLVIGPESFLTNAAGAFDTPEILFFSHSAPENLSKYYENCFNVIPLPQVTCHPCYLIQINFQHIYDPLKRGVAREFERSCREWNPDFIYESLGCKCCYHLPHEEILQAITGFLKAS